MCSVTLRLGSVEAIMRISSKKVVILFFIEVAHQVKVSVVAVTFFSAHAGVIKWWLPRGELHRLILWSLLCG